MQSVTEENILEYRRTRPLRRNALLLMALWNAEGTD